MYELTEQMKQNKDESRAVLIKFYRQNRLEGWLKWKKTNT